jgi:hypothetical protein
LATQLTLILDDVAMFTDGADPRLSRSQIERMLHAVVEWHLAKLDREALATKNSLEFEPEQA